MASPDTRPAGVDSQAPIAQGGDISLPKIKMIADQVVPGAKPNSVGPDNNICRLGDVYVLRAHQQQIISNARSSGEVLEWF